MTTGWREAAAGKYGSLAEALLGAAEVAGLVAVGVGAPFATGFAAWVVVVAAV